LGLARSEMDLSSMLPSTRRRTSLDNSALESAAFENAVAEYQGAPAGERTDALRLQFQTAAGLQQF
jgi:hypothetical protein